MAACTSTRGDIHRERTPSAGVVVSARSAGAFAAVSFQDGAVLVNGAKDNSGTSPQLTLMIAPSRSRCVGEGRERTAGKYVRVRLLAPAHNHAFGQMTLATTIIISSQTPHHHYLCSHALPTADVPPVPLSSPSINKQYTARAPLSHIHPRPSVCVPETLDGTAAVYLFNYFQFSSVHPSLRTCEECAPQLVAQGPSLNRRAAGVFNQSRL